MTDNDRPGATTARGPWIEVEVASGYGQDSDQPGQDQHNVYVTVGGVTVFSRTYFEKADTHHGDHGWDPVNHFAAIGAAEFGHTLARLVRAFEDSR